MSALNARQLRLLEELQAWDAPVTTGRIHVLNRDLGAPKRTTARADMAALHRHGLLTPGGADSYRLDYPTARPRPGIRDLAKGDQ